MSAFTPRHASARIRASRGLALIVFIAFSRGSLAASQACDEKTITRKSIAKLTRSARVAIVQLDVLVDRDDVVAASLSTLSKFLGQSSRIRIRISLLPTIILSSKNVLA